MPKISLSGPADLLTILPFHLGFQPTRSVVVVCFHGKRLGLVARFDVVPAHLAEASAATGLPTIVRERPSGVCLVGFEDEAGESDPLTEALRAGLAHEDIEVGDRLIVRDGRWFTTDCDCCPPGGRPMPELADVPAVADYVALGHAVLGDRDSLVALVRPLGDDDPRHADIEAAVDTWQARYTVAVAIDRLRARGLLIDDASGERSRDDRSGDGSELGDGGDEVGEDGHLGDLGEETAAEPDGTSGAGDRGATVIDLETRRHLGPEDVAGGWNGVDGWDGVDGAAGWDDWDDDGYGDGGWDGAGWDGDCDSFDAAFESSSELQQAQSMTAWGHVLHGEVAGDDLEALVPALVGPLRDVIFRDALIAWLCPDSMPLTDYPAGLVALLEAFVGVDVRAASGATSAAPRPRPRRGRRKRGRRLRGRLDGLAEAPSGQAGQEWQEWEEASAPHQIQARLESVCRVTPAAHAAPLLTIVANIAWWRGDGARAGVAVDTALGLEPDHRLARLIRQALDHGLRGDGSRSSQHDADGPSRASGSWNSPSSA
ncbi:DUF4192 domain-containing protein [Humibacillus xanthopallidus]|uniref:DUF4192 domain-containing protein n=1 Tax=Humibacillus xanthopallidus TaxID=412689 RepID=UPI00384A6F33